MSNYSSLKKKMMLQEDPVTEVLCVLKWFLPHCPNPREAWLQRILLEDSENSFAQKKLKKYIYLHS